MTPQNYGTVSSFELGFVTLPEALAQMPGAQFWSVLFFFTLYILGMSSAFAMIDAFITMVYDTDWAKKYPRIFWSSIIVTTSFLVSLIYATEFGFWLLDAIDTHTNNLALFFVVWAECVSATILYRHVDVIGQVGWPAFLTHNGGYFFGQLLGVIVGHTVSPGAGAGVGFGLYIGGVIGSLVCAKTPDSIAPGFFARNVWLNKLYWMAFYSVRHRDCNVLCFH
jgi:solute carrier family 6 GABA transporter-like protein 1